jgi:glycosyltransferase involved in cell wall biosynthesis
VTDVHVSVGVPAHNNASTIGLTIDSLRRQTHEDWDCFVSCDAESSATFDAAQRSIGGDTRFTLVTNRERSGVPGNWNEVFAHASGKYFKLLCADDVLYPPALASQVSAMEYLPSAVLCVGRRRIVDSRGRTIIRDRGLKHINGLLGLDDLVSEMLKSGTNPVGEPSFALYRTDVLRALGGFSSKWQYTIDLASYIEMLKSGGLVTVDAVIGAMRVSSSSWSSMLAGQQSREMRAALDFALSSSTLNVSRTDLMIARTKIVVTSALRRALSRISFLRHPTT